MLFWIPFGVSAIYLGLVFLLLKNKKIKVHPAVLAAGLILIKFLIALIVKGFPTDISCFSAWASRLADVGPWNFYQPDYFADYPPGYMLVLWVIGLKRNLFNLDYNGAAFNLLLKSPAILADVAIGWIIYRLAKKRYDEPRAGALMVLFALNPVIVINSSLWGQIDSFFVLFILLAILLIKKDKLVWGIVSYTVSALIKPQAFLFAPVFLLAYFTYKKAWPMVLAGLASAATFLLALLPFKGFNVVWLVQQYASTLSSYAYATVNAFNVYALFGMNWTSIEGIQFFSILNWCVILGAVAAAIVLFFKTKKECAEWKNLFISAFIVIVLFNLATKMHERYIYPAVIFLAVAYVISRRAEIGVLVLGLSIALFLNCYYILFSYLEKLNSNAIIISIVSICNLAILCYSIYVAYTMLRKKEKGGEADVQEV